MEDRGGFIRDGDDDQIKLHPGFRFHPTDEELITHYLLPKVLDAGFGALAIGEADLNKMEPWQLPRLAKIGEEEWYFFCARDKKYPAGMRTNRATESGYWKATGKDKEIYKDESLVGMKKTLVFYRGRAPKGLKTNWVIHEYRLEGKYSHYNLPESAKTEWVISRVFNKSSAGRKTHISALMELNHHGGDFFQEPSLPPLADSSPYNSACETKSTVGSSPPLENHGDSVENNNFLPNNPLSSSSCYHDGFQFSDSFFNQDQSTLKLLVNDNGDCGGNDLLSSFSTAERPRGLWPGGGDFSGDGPIDLDCLLNY